MGYRDYSVAKGHIVDAAGHGDFTTIGAAMTAAVSGETIYVLDGTYTENVTLKDGVALETYQSASNSANVVIAGTLTLSGGDSTISGFWLAAPSGSCISVDGTAQALLFVYNCQIVTTNSNGISFTNTDATSSIYLFDAFGFDNTTNSFFISSSPGTIQFFNCQIGGSSTTASTISNGQLSMTSCDILSPIALSGTAAGAFYYCYIAITGATAITTSGTSGVNCEWSTVGGTTASAISIGAGTNFTLIDSSIFSSNANAITGAGTLRYAFVTFIGTSSNVNVTTQIPLPTLPGGGMFLIQTQTVTNAANISFTTGITTAFNTYFLVWNNITSVTGSVSFYLRFSVDGGATYLLTGYNVLALRWNVGGVGVDMDTTGFLLCEPGNFSNAIPAYGNAYLQNLTSGAQAPSVNGTYTWPNIFGPSPSGGNAAGYGPTGIVVNAIRLVMSAGNISGTVSLYGVQQ